MKYPKVLFLPFICFLCSCQKKSILIDPCVVSSSFLVSSEEKWLLGAVFEPLTQEDIHRLYKSYPKTLEKIKKRENLSPQDIINMTRAGVADSVIIQKILDTRSQFFLTPQQEEELMQAGVSQKVIQSMKETIEY